MNLKEKLAQVGIVKILTVFAICLMSLTIVFGLTESAKQELIEYNTTSTKINLTQFGGKLITQLEVDKNYPCYLQSSGKVICPVIESAKLDSLKVDLKSEIKDEEIKGEDGKPETDQTKISAEKDKLVDSKISKGIPVVDYRKPKYKSNGTETWTDEEGKVWDINISTFDGYETSYFDLTKENEFNLDTSINGKVRVGFNSNVWSVTDFSFGSSENVTAKSYGIALENNHQDSDSSMVAHYKFTDDATDSSGNGNDGTVHGAVHNFSWYEFDGNDYINFGNDSSLDLIYTFSYSFWIYPYKKASYYQFFKKADNIWSNRSTFSLTIEDDDDLHLRLTPYDASGPGEQGLYSLHTDGLSEGRLSMEEWQQYVFTYSNETGSIKLYKNGISVKNSSNTPKTLMSRPDDLKLSDLLGSFDELIAYNKTLTATEISDIYNKNLFKYQGNYTSGILDAGQKVNWTNINWTYSNSTSNQNVSLYARTGEIAKPDFSDASLVSMWSLNQTDRVGTTAIDTMNRNNGTANGGMSLGQTGGVFQGENATGFDGVDDYVNCGNDISLKPSNISISAWIKTNSLGSISHAVFMGERYTLRQTSLNKFEGGTWGCNVISDESIKVGEWNYLTYTYNGTNGVLYVNGIQDGTPCSGDTRDGTEILKIGQRGDGNEFNGSIAYVSIFNKSLTSDEIMNWSTYTGKLLQADGETLDLPINRFLQYKAELKTNTSETPILTSVNAEYDGTAPNVTINNPLNKTYTTTTITFNVTALDDTEMGSCSYSLDGASNISMTNSTTSEWNATNSSMTQGSHTVNFYCKDISNNLNNTESVTFFVDSISPVVNLTLENNTYTNNSNVNFTSDLTDNLGLVNATIYIYNSAGSLVNETFQTISSVTSYTWGLVVNLTDDVYTWFVTTFDIAGNSATSENYTLTVDTTPPTCELISVSHSDVEINSTGTYELLINCTDVNTINGTTFIITRTVEDSNGDNYWSIRPPHNDKSTFDSRFNENILLADTRVVGDMWYESLFSDNYTYAVTINTTPTGQNPYVDLDCSGTSCLMNYSAPIESALFPSTMYLSRGKMEVASKFNYSINKDDGLLLQFWNGKEASGYDNYTANLFMNLGYESSLGSRQLEFYYCNSSYDKTGGVAPQDEYDNCVYMNSLSKSDLDTKSYSSRKSSYIQKTFSVINGKMAGIVSTNKSYMYLRSLANTPHSFYVKYSNQTSGTNVSFKDSKVAWYSINDGDSFTQAEFTPDVWVSQLSLGSISKVGVIVQDDLGNTYTNYSFISDDIGDVNHPISSPNIQFYNDGICGIGSCTLKDENLNETYNGNMTIHTNIAIDPDSIGNVTHSLTLRNLDGTLNYTINGSFKSSDDSDVHIYFDTNNAPDGIFKMNISATSGDDSTDIKSYLTDGNFTIDNTNPNLSIITPTDGYTVYDYVSGSVPIVTNFSLTEINSDSCWYTIDGGVANTSINCSSGYNNFTFHLSAVGTFTLKISANDSAGNENSSSINLTVSEYTGSQSSGGPTVNPSENEEVDFNLYNNTIMCEEIKEFLDLRTENYTSDQRESLKNSLALLFGFGMIDSVLDEYLENFEESCPQYFDTPDEPVVVADDPDEENFWNSKALIFIIVGGFIVFVILVIMLDINHLILSKRKNNN